MKEIIKKYKVGVTAAIIEVVLVIVLLCEAFIGDYNPLVGNTIVALIWICVVVTLIDVWRNFKR